MEITEEIKQEIFRLIVIPGKEVEDIAKELNNNFNTNLDYEQIMQILSDEYLKNNLDYGRRLCCRF